MKRPAPCCRWTPLQRPLRCLLRDAPPPPPCRRCVSFVAAAQKDSPEEGEIPFRVLPSVIAALVYPQRPGSCGICLLRFLSSAMAHRGWWKLVLVLAVGLPAIYFRLGAVQLGPLPSVGLYGAAVVSAAFLLSWAAEAFQIDVSASLATAALALGAVLPEYAVDLYLSYSAGPNPAHTQYAIANMTRSDRFVIGILCALVARRALLA